jgi:hypothetical protein
VIPPTAAFARPDVAAKRPEYGSTAQSRVLCSTGLGPACAACSYRHSAVRWRAIAEEGLVHPDNVNFFGIAKNRS